LGGVFNALNGLALKNRLDLWHYHLRPRHLQHLYDNYLTQNMAESVSRGGDTTPLLEGGETEKAYKLANSITLQRLSSKIKANPTVDLSNLLLQQCNSYPELRRNLAQAASTKASAPEYVEESKKDGDDRQFDFSHLLLCGEVEVTCPLGKPIVSLANATDDVSNLMSGEIRPSLVSGLNGAIESGEILWNLHDTVVLDIGASLAVKIGASLDPDGITNLQHINAHAPDVPTPLLLGALESDRRTYVFMSRAEGVTLESVWPQLSTTDKLSVQQQLNGIFRTLRAYSPGLSVDGDDRPRIGSFVSGTCKDMRRMLRTSDVPIHDEEDFNDFLCRQSQRTQTPWIKMIRSFMSKNHRIVMTHGDLHPRNIMVHWQPNAEDGSGGREPIRVTSLIDWELGGWYPEHWEFVRALATVGMRGPLADWCDFLPTEAIGSWPVEFSMDLLISRWLG
jgi:hypothetical protein